MRRALELSLNGPAVGINPQVGAVILDEFGNIAAEGWHEGSGTPHAEVMAIHNLRTKLGVHALPQNYTAVVTLEPCNHTGKTGPCSLALIEAGIANVVYASSDPGDASSNGAQVLRNAGIEVLSGVLLQEAEEQNRVWLTANRLKRPFVTLKYASSLDGRSAAEDGSSQWISGPESRAESHLRRSEVDAILVGTGTAIDDDPELTARKPDGSYYENQPLRVVLGESELSKDLRIFNDKAQTLELKTRSIHGALAELWARGIKHVWVEGGPKVASKFEKLGLVDEYIIYLAPMLIGGEKTSLRNIGVENIKDAHKLKFVETKMLGEDIFIRARRS
ncbi:MAG: bifunctional diaminohydroxyphosphoribosylaminopyrimidine deaminase/5-amino-6-(5-phosphoribosylamino)uracil reductase RibD [Aquiluna sp.]|nr:bifunctional diaminohydroxyphosphoribosylaminopyrimidine deaminase/5-amino-6-(5-phosphoribosylamino)uracil reductase RibD [Aquiluna sp.]MCF8546232.1 bifunctional diaminohydroxyphosphoribosylaminopyrimidine deaminase/5-amino-6-(5-phosphoribosylamino)uracil reductase RibD [Aquiluna sp.]